MEIIAYTDGSSIILEDGTKLGGYGVYFNDNKKWNISKPLKGTNQQAELKACIEAIKKVIRMMKNKKWSLTIYSDSKYSINCATVWSKNWILNGWKKEKGSKYETPCNIKLIKKLYTLTCMYPVKFCHVKSHRREPDKSSNEWVHWHGNDQADALAKSAMQKLKTEHQNEHC